MIVPGETEAGSAGKQPCRGIPWWAHRDDDRSAAASLPRFKKHIGSVDPNALKIQSPQGANCRLNGERAPPSQTGPEYLHHRVAVKTERSEPAGLPRQWAPPIHTLKGEARSPGGCRHAPRKQSCLTHRSCYRAQKQCFRRAVVNRVNFAIRRGEV